MQKFSYINQMNGFLTRMSEDALPANAVMLYLILFHKFNRSCWRQEWMKFTLQQLMAFSHVGSPNTVYSMRSLLKELGYIDYRPAQNGNRSQTEYRLLPLSSANSNAVTISQPSGYEFSDNDFSENENPHNNFPLEFSESENCRHTDFSKSENCQPPEFSKNENRTPCKFSKSENSAPELSSEFSGEFSKTERRTDNSLIEKEKDKTRNTTHVTTATDQADNKNISENKSININKAPMTVNEFCQTNGDYLLCLDAYRDYFKKEPPSEDKVKLIRFLAEYGADSTLQAMDIMARNRADSLNYCEGVLRRRKWQPDRTAVRRPASNTHSHWQGWKMA